MRRLLYILFLLIWSMKAGAQVYDDEKLDSLAKAFYALSDRDTAKLSIAIDISAYHYNSDSVAVWGQRVLRLADLQSSMIGFAKGYIALSNSAYYLLDYERSLDFAFKALSYAEMDGGNTLQGICCQCIGDALSYIQDYSKADSYYYKALDFFRKDNDLIKYSHCIYLLSDNLIIQKLFRQADSLLNEADSICVAMNNDYDLGLVYETKSVLYFIMYTYSMSEPALNLLDSCKLYGIKSLGFEDLMYRGAIVASRAMLFECIENQYQGERRKEILDSVIRLNQVFRERIETMDFDMDPEISINEAVEDMLRGDLKEARILLDSIAPMVQDTEFQDNFDIVEYYFYWMTGDYRRSQKSLARFYENVNSSISIDKAAATAQNLAENNYREETRKREIREEQRKRMFVYIIVVVLLVLAFIVFEYFRKRRHNKILNEKNNLLQSQKEEILQQKEELNASKDELFARNEEITAQNEQIIQKNRQITDSINYASIIQKAALPRPEDISALFGDYFLIYRPLNIVAGDFYWASQVGKYHIFVCADCTGHGVPGAFVSMLGISLLNEVTANVSASTSASDILNELRAKLMRALGQSKKKYENGSVYSMDGMDLAMVMIDYENMSLQFSGAYRPLWIWRKGELLQYKPDKMPIGLYLGPEKDFTTQVIGIQEADVLYMFSDGIPDQFGYTDDTHTSSKHFSTKRLAALITEIGGDPLPQQKARIESEVDAWKNGHKQLDDNILIGIRI